MRFCNIISSCKVYFNWKGFDIIIHLTELEMQHSVVFELFYFHEYMKRLMHDQLNAI